MVSEWIEFSYFTLHISEFMKCLIHSQIYCFLYKSLCLISSCSQRYCVKFSYDIFPQQFLFAPFKKMTNTSFPLIICPYHAMIKSHIPGFFIDICKARSYAGHLEMMCILHVYFSFLTKYSKLDAMKICFAIYA